MSTIEIVICLIFLFMAVPDLCNRLGRPALAYSVFILFGFVAGPLIHGDVATMLKEAGYVGFLLLLFEVGLEIDLPRFRELNPTTGSN
ncbi:MAG TPA: cation:proton antiporter [Verrucomicrobiae bacterium]